jgi:cell wall-associated NlpC family hydrolase
MEFSPDVIAAVYAHAAMDNPREACGLVVEIGGAQVYVPAANTAEKPERDFRISAEAWADAEDLGKVLCVAHSHPGQSAKLSGADRVSMEATELPWLIVEVREGVPTAHLLHLPTGYQAPLVGRPFYHGVLDCYTLVRDFYQREMGIELQDYDRKDEWWANGGDLYMQNYAACGFEPVDDLQHGDVVIMQVRAPVPNHAGIYLADGVLKTEPDHHPVPGGILHHLHGRDSKRDVYGGYWAEATHLVLRHKHAKLG